MITAPLTSKIIGTLLAIYAAGVLLIMFLTGSPAELTWWLWAALFLVWTVAPISATFLILSRVKKSGNYMILSIVLMGFAVVSGLYIYVNDMFGPGARSTSALIFIFLPIYQWISPLIAIAILGISRAVRPGRD